MTRSADVRRELLYPLTSGAVLITLLCLFFALQFILVAGLYGLVLALFLLPVASRYLMLLLKARLRGRDPGAPGIELFLWFDDAWQLFPIVYAAIVVHAAMLFGSVIPTVFLPAMLILAATLLPAALLVLAVSHSPLESLRPAALLAVIRRCHPAYWIAPAFLAGSALACWWLANTMQGGFLLDAAAVYLTFAAFALIGGLARPFELERDVGIPEPVEPGQDELEEQRIDVRRRILDHAYGFVSRGNRDGGLRHIYQGIATDPEPEAAWSWYLHEMLEWERPQAALVFAQRYLHELLAAGDAIGAVKLMLRCRLFDENFRPLTEDRSAALAAAEQCQHAELSNFLR